MADTYSPGPADGPSFMQTAGRSVARWTNYAGAAASIALMVGVGVWGTKLIMRDMSGIPVVRAAEGPMRIAPEQPGGQPAAHLGLSVNDVAGLGIAAAPADTLRLAPVDDTLTDEDVAFADVVPDVPTQAMAEASETAPLPTLAELTSDAENPTEAIHQLADRLSAGVAPLAPAGDDLDDTPPEVRSALAALGVAMPEETAPIKAVATVAEARIIPASVPGVSVSLRPAPRPAALARRVAAAAPPEPLKPAEVEELDADSVAAGTRLVQLGAYDSVETARSEWNRLAARFGDFLDGHARVIEKASSGGKTFYRLRAHGFEDLSDARRFCAAFVAENADCIPLVTR
ncbi:hypothetical protein ATO8_00425 [Roseivivax marinus]|uniref:SPOR domain-containing protein n=1 Tax=Roseivivax marinus TaxID=1379903 RepID=W4HPH4_9RHOB|nr:SPOR domain-containing protein [Roseivivax marinus]ETW14328.1 hypothetical protein ATO8_00425 [Roseivivax marinus]